jgi:hypothetical protein
MILKPNILSSIKAGAVAGLAGGVVFGMMMGMMGMLQLELKMCAILDGNEPLFLQHPH